MKLLILIDNKNAIAKDGKQILFIDDDLHMVPFVGYVSCE